MRQEPTRGGRGGRGRGRGRGCGRGRGRGRGRGGIASGDSVQASNENVDTGSDCRIQQADANSSDSTSIVVSARVPRGPRALRAPRGTGRGRRPRERSPELRNNLRTEGMYHK